ncbi:MAG: hypothetical protein KDD45_12270 [Bdellovibrionales bacterium]|nr:hypothetical protein [Bdellovibrionales bacterium]
MLNQEDSEEEELTPQKKAFDYDFSQEHRLYNQPEPPKKEEPKIVLTPEEQAALEKKLEKQRL